MKKSEALEAACNNFQSLVSGFEANRAELEEQYLFKYLEDGIDVSNGNNVTDASHELFVREALGIADAAMQGDVSLDYTPPKPYSNEPYQRNITAIHNPDDPHDCFDQRNYDSFAWRQGPGAQQE